MYPYKDAVKLIKTFEGFHEKAYCDYVTGGEPYTIGYGTNFYPDGTPVKKGHRCTNEKAIEYLLHEVNIIAHEITKQNLGLDSSMLNALISFAHSVGWDSFLYSSIIDCCERDDHIAASHEITRWIFDEQHKVIGGLIDRRREEVKLFTQELNANPWTSDDILLKAFRNYSAAPNEVRAIRKLQENINPYVLSEFANEFEIDSNPYPDITDSELDQIFNAWD